MNLSPSEQAFWDFCRQWLIERDEAAETEKTAEEENTAAVEEPLQN